MGDLIKRGLAWVRGLVPHGAEEIDTYKRIFSLTWPAFCELFLSAMFGAVDMFMVGRIGSEEGTMAMAAVGLTNQPFQLLISIFAAVNVGTTTLIAWNYGAGRKDKAEYIARQSITFNIFAGAGLGAFGVLAAPVITNFMGKEPEVIAIATAYLRIICAGVPFQAVNMCIAASFRGCGQTRVPMVYNLVSNAINVGLNYIMIYGKLGCPAMGANGAALATTISRVVATAIACWFLFAWKRSPIRMTLKGSWRPDLAVIRDVFRIGIPAAGEQLVIQSGLMIYSKMLAGLGAVAYAAQQVLGSVNGMAFSISQAFQVSNTTLVGHAVGADDYPKAELHTKLCARTARVVTAVVASMFIMFSRQICALATDNEAVIDAAAPVFVFMALIQFMQSTQMSTAGALRAAGDTMYPLYATICGIWVFRISMAAVFIYLLHWGLMGAWFSFFLDQSMRSFIIRRRFKSGKWKEMKAIKLAKMEAQKAKSGAGGE